MDAGHDEVIVSRVHRAIVRMLAPGDEADAILDDLAEEAAQVAVAASAPAARRWVRWQIANSIVPWLTRRSHDWLARAKEMRVLPHGLWIDVRIAFRRLAKARGFAALACLTLAIGIAAVSTVFSLAYALWLKPLPYGDPDRLVWVGTRHEPSGAGGSLTPTELDALRTTGSRTLNGLAGFMYGAAIARVNGEPVRIAQHQVSPNLFRVLGVAPAIGRDFTDHDAGSGTAIVILSHQSWLRHWGRDPAVVGKTMMLSGEPHTVVGVMPDGFTFPRGLEAGMWTPAPFRAGNIGPRRIIQAVGRLAAGQTIAAATQEADAKLRAVANAAPGDGRWVANVTTAATTASTTAQRSFQALLGTVGLFLLITCTNLAGLLLARNAARRTELAVCLSIGASRWRLARSLLIESLLVAAGGCGIGIVLTFYAARMLASLMPAWMPGLDGVAVNGIVVAVTIAVACAAAFLIALAPALSLRSMRASEALAGSRTATAAGSRAQRALVVVEIALAVVLLVGAAVMLRAFQGLVNQDRGYEPRGLVALNVTLPFSDESFSRAETRVHALDQLLAGVKAVPGVRSVGATTGFPGSRLGILGGEPFTPPGGTQIFVALHAATPEYFATMGIPIRAGRSLTALDTAGAPPVAIVNEALARQFPDGNPIGHHVPITVPGEPRKPFEIVGVAGNIRLSENIGNRVFIPLAQASPYWIDLVVRGDEALMPTIRQTLRTLNRDLLLENDSSFGKIISDNLAIQRTQSVFTTLTGALSILVAGVGLYALMTFLLTARRRDLSIRLALGSSPGRLFREAMLGALRLIAIGIAAGIAITATLVQLIGSRVFGLASADVTAYAGAATLVLIVAVLAAIVPVRRVLRADPVAALRAS